MTDPVGEDGWLALAEEARRTASNLEQCVEVVELFKCAVTVEPCSKNIWLAYCEWVWSLYQKCQINDTGWSEEERLLGKEIFNLNTTLDVWKQGARATKYRLNDSHEIWNKWMAIELENLSESPTAQNIECIQQLFIDRLQVPHATWDDTSQMLSTFLTKYNETSWEATMVEVTRISKDAKEQYIHRGPFESKLQKAIEAGDSEAIKSQALEYLNWEQGQVLKSSRKGYPSNSLLLCVGLFERALALSPFRLDPVIWEDFLAFIMNNKIDSHKDQLPSILSVCHRATNHCPWSGVLWARYILCAEAEPLPFSHIEQIKHAATNTRDLDKNGMDDVILLYTAWCGYLRRRTMVEDTTDDDIDLVEMGLPTALDDVQHWGKRRLGNAWKGDPHFHIETLLIQNLSEKGALEEARTLWRRLSAIHADSYDFWYQYYQWEMKVRSPREKPNLATAVLTQAIRCKTLDWPEKIMEIYVKHCHTHENISNLLQALDTVHRISKGVAKRREREAANYHTKEPQTDIEKEANELFSNTEAASELSKRKREDEEEYRGNSKKIKVIDQTTTQDQYLKRDRENTTVIVTNLPVEVTQTKVKQYFKDYAHINNLLLKKESDGSSSTALIELRSREDVQSILLKHNKYFGDRQISVKTGTGLTLFVTNYPPTADDDYFHQLFKDCGEILSIRWPSVKYKTTRRFVYISFRTPEAAEAAIRLDGLSLGGIYKLSLAFSNPNNKKEREGATAEGREIHVTNLDTSLTEDEVREVFSNYGTVQRVNILRKLSGKSKGAAFIVFEKKEEALTALELNKTKLKACVLSVEISKEKNFKPTATMTAKASTVEDAESGGDISSLPKSENYKPCSPQSKSPPSSLEISSRTIVLFNIPDTINDSRIHVLASSFGDITRLVLRPDQKSATIEYAHAASAGKAALSLENYEILPGQRLRVDTSRNLFNENKTRIDKKSAARLMQQTAFIRRPITHSKTRMSTKRIEYPKPSTKVVSSNKSDDKTEAREDNSHKDGKKQMTNADFKSLFLNKS